MKRPHTKEELEDSIDSINKIFEEVEHRCIRMMIIERFLIEDEELIERVLETLADYKSEALYQLDL